MAFQRFVDPLAALIALHEDIVSFLRLLPDVMAIWVQRAVQQHPIKTTGVMLLKPAEGHAASAVKRRSLRYFQVRQIVVPAQRVIEPVPLIVYMLWQIVHRASFHGAFLLMLVFIKQSCHRTAALPQSQLPCPVDTGAALHPRSWACCSARAL